MTTKEKITELYPGRLKTPGSVRDIPQGVYVVYILVCDDKPIVVGHGKHNRARVIFDNDSQTTSGHIKAIFVRAHHLFGAHKSFERYFITCDSKSEAKEIEKNLHNKIGGNCRSLPEQIQQRIFANIDAEGVTAMILRIALNSSFDGMSDLKLWRRKGILNDQIWKAIADRFKLQDKGENAE